MKTGGQRRILPVYLVRLACIFHHICETVADRLAFIVSVSVGNFYESRYLAPSMVHALNATYWKVWTMCLLNLNSRNLGYQLVSELEGIWDQSERGRSAKISPSHLATQPDFVLTTVRMMSMPTRSDMHIRAY